MEEHKGYMVKEAIDGKYPFWMSEYNMRHIKVSHSPLSNYFICLTFGVKSMISKVILYIYMKCFLKESLLYEMTLDKYDYDTKL